ncbi:hypothetical protein [Marinobacter mobilis]|uniref:hypothetical protein n=1 Tax=Marinobacter mobilis TaxID=488533 RepID=UPI0035C70D63
MKLKTLRNASAKALIKAQLAMSAPKQQKGATALEYIVLAAAIIIIVGVLASNTTVQTTLTNAFNNLFTNAQTP